MARLYSLMACLVRCVACRRRPGRRQRLRALAHPGLPVSHPWSPGSGLTALSVIVALLAVAAPARSHAQGFICSPSPCTNPPPTITITGAPSFTTSASIRPFVSLCSAGFGVAAETVYVNGTQTSWPWANGGTSCPDTASKVVSLNVGTNTFTVAACSAPGNGNQGSCGRTGVTISFDDIQVTPKQTSPPVSVGINFDTAMVFSLHNSGATAATFNLSYPCTGSGVSNCRGPATASIGANGTVTVTELFHIGNAGLTGTVILKAVDSGHPAGVDSGYVAVTAAWDNLAVATSYTNQEDQDYTRCANTCFAAVAAMTTPAHYSKDVGNGVTLVYNGDHAVPRPIILADVRFKAAGTTAQDIQMQVKVNNAFVRFINGQDTLHFAPGPGNANSGNGQTFRIGGQFDAGTLGNATYPLQVIVTAVYASHTEQVIDSTHRLALNSTRNLGYARGWALAEYSHLYYQSDGGDNYLAIGEGDGSVRLYGPVQPAGCGSPPCVWKSVTQGVTDSLVWTQPCCGPVFERRFIDGSTWIYDLNFGGMIRYRIDRLGDTTYYGYTSAVQLDTITDPYRTYLNGSSLQHTYTILTYSGPGGTLSSIAEPGPGPGNVPGAGRVTTLTVAAADSTLTAWTDPDGLSTRFSYDTAHRLTGIIDRRGDTTTYTYVSGGAGKLSSIAAPRVPIDSGSTGTVVTVRPTVTYQPWQLVGVPSGLTDTLHQATPVLTTSIVGTVVGAAGDRTTYTVDRWGEPLVLVDALQDTTTFSRDPSTGLAYLVASPNGGHVWNQFTNGLVTTQIASGHDTLSFRYGIFAQLDSAWGRHTPLTTYHLRTNDGLPDTVRVNGLLQASYFYDLRHRLTEVTDAAGHTSQYAYDDNGSASGNLTSQAFNWSNAAWSKSFDGYGRVFTTTGGTTGLYPADSSYYDALNRVTAEHDGVHPRPDSTYYDPQFPTIVTDGKGQRWQVAPNALGWDTAATDPRGGAVHYTYTAAGKVATVTNRRGQTVTYKYDLLGRLVQKVDPVAGDTVKYAYHTGRNSVWVAASVWTATGRPMEADTTYADSTGWTDSVKTFISATNKTYTQHYWPNGRYQLDSVTVGGSPLTYTWATQRFVWDSLTGLLDSSYINTSGTRYHYTVERLLDSTYYAGGAVQFDTVMDTHQRILTKFTAASLDTAFHRAYLYDSAGRLTEIDRVLGSGTGIDQIQYDGAQEVVWQMLGTAARSYLGSCAANRPNCHLDTNVTALDSVTVAYDSTGNLRTITDPPNIGDGATGAYVTGNRDTAWIRPGGDTTRYTYDADGNRATKRGFDGSITTYTWSADGRLLSVASGSHVVSYQYYPNGLLFRRSFGSTPVVNRYYLWDRGNLRAEIDSTGANRITEYVSGLGTDVPLARITGSGTGTLHYLVQDIRGNVVGQFTGTTVEQELAYGVLGRTDVIGSVTHDTTALRWKGLYWEGDSTQMYYVRGRWYDPTTHRFASEDPAGQGLNLYTFAAGDPVNGSDPTGMAYCSATGGCGLTPFGTGDPNTDDPGSCVTSGTACSMEGISVTAPPAWVAAQLAALQQLPNEALRSEQQIALGTGRGGRAVRAIHNVQCGVAIAAGLVTLGENIALLTPAYAAFKAGATLATLAGVAIDAVADGTINNLLPSSPHAALIGSAEFVIPSLAYLHQPTANEFVTSNIPLVNLYFAGKDILDRCH